MNNITPLLQYTLFWINYLARNQKQKPENPICTSFSQRSSPLPLMQQSTPSPAMSSNTTMRKSTRTSHIPLYVSRIHIYFSCISLAAKQSMRERKREDLLDASGVQLAIFDAVGELVEGFALLLQVLRVHHSLYPSVVSALHFFFDRLLSVQSQNVRIWNPNLSSADCCGLG